MSSGGRRLLGLCGAVVLLTTAALTGIQLDRSRKGRVIGEAQRLGVDASRRVKDALSVQTEALVLLTTNAVANPLLLTALRGGVDARTLADIFRTENWWAPYRTASAAISYDGTKLAFAQDPDAVPAVMDTVRAVREKRQAISRTAVSHGRPLLVAGAGVVLSPDQTPAVLVLCRTLDDTALQGLSTRADAPILLSDERGVLSAGGRPQDVDLLRSAVGSESQQRLVTEDGTWAAIAAPLAPGLWVWTGASALEFARELAATDRTKKRVLWLLALLAGAAAVAVTWRPRVEQAAPSKVVGEETTTPVETSASLLAQMAEGGSRPRLLTGAVSSPGAGIPLGRYVLLERIGEGGMAEVFTSVSFGSNGFRRFFVVKRLRPEMSNNPLAVAHFIDEANLASTLVHPNIVPVFDFGEVEGTYYLAQEYIVGRDLGRLRRRMAERADRPLSSGAILYLAHELLNALEYAHDKRDDDGSPLHIVHRDVTPENVLVSERGEVKLLDFGIVKSAQGRLAQTEIGHVKGNVDFMAPEQARGKPVDRRADLFSVGLVLYFAAAAEPLYRGETLYDRLQRAATGPGPEELARLTVLPHPLPDILRRALSVNPDERFQNAADFRAVLAEHIEGGDAELAAAVARNFERDLHLEQERLTSAFPRARTRGDVPTEAGKQG